MNMRYCVRLARSQGLNIRLRFYQAASTSYMSSSDVSDVRVVNKMCIRKQIKYPWITATINITTRTLSSCSNDNTTLHRGVSEEIYKQLSIFPEYSLIQKYHQQGKFELMIPQLLRIVDILSSVNIGIYSVLRYETIYQLIRAYKYLGLYHIAIKYLDDHVTSNLNDDNINSLPILVKILQSKAVCYLLHGDPSEGLKVSSDALTLCEQHDVHIDLLSACNATVGICSLYNQLQHQLTTTVTSSQDKTSNSDLNTTNTTPDDLSSGVDYADAVSYLQTSARWSSTPYDQLITLNNLGM